MPAALYLRISRDDGATTAIDRQRADCLALAASRGWEVADEYVDADVSAFSGVDRPAFRRLLDDLEAGVVDSVVAYRVDRLARRLVDLEHLLDTLERTGATLATVADPVDGGTVLGRAMLRIATTLGSAESETTRLRVRRAKAENAQAGHPNGGGRRPFGHTADQRELVEDEAALVREAVSRVLAGETTYTVAKDWHARDVHGTTGANITASNLGSILRSPRLAGFRQHNGQIIPSDIIPPIVSEADWRRVRSVLDGRRGTQGRASYRLSGLVTCGICGGTMSVKRRYGARETQGIVYRCIAIPGSTSCGRTAITGRYLEALVGEAVAAAVDEEGLAAALARARGGEQTTALLADLEAARARKDALAADYGAGLVDRDTFLMASRAATDAVTRYEGQLARLSRSRVLATLTPGEDIRVAWAEREPGWGRELARSLLDGVTVLPAGKGRPRFDPDRVVLRWHL